MISALNAMVFALVLVGAGGMGIVAEMEMVPLEKAIEIHEDNLGQDSTMPDQCRKGQQNALDHLRWNQERWIANHAE